MHKKDSSETADQDRHDEIVPQRVNKKRKHKEQLVKHKNKKRK
jgi:hypothetical protein